MSEIKPNDRTEGNREEKDSAAAKVCSDNLKSNKPRPSIPDSAVTIAVSPCALFDMEAERDAHQVENESEPLKPGAAFPFVKALMTVNARLRELYPESEELFYIIVLMTNNHAERRLINSINHYALTRVEVCPTRGQSPIDYLRIYNAKLYLSKDSESVTEAIEEGFAAATMFMPDMPELSNTQLRVVFDGDGVLFSDESEKVMKLQGLDAFLRNEMQLEDVPMTEGPLKCFLEALGKLQRKFYAKNERMNCPIRTFLITARGGDISGARALKTLRSWGLEINEVYLLDGAPKGPLLQLIKPHIFFDDKMSCIIEAKELGTISAHVPYGISQI